MRATVKDIQVEDTYKARYYGKVEINEGKFTVPKTINELDYEDLDKKGVSGILAQDDASFYQVYFIFSELNLTKLMNFKAQPYQFYVFSRSESFLDIQILVDHLFVTVAAFWMPYLFIGSFMYLVIAGVIIR